MRLFGVFLFLILFSCKDDPTIVELKVRDANLLPADSAMVIFTGDPYDSSYTNEIIFNKIIIITSDLVVDKLCVCEVLEVTACCAVEQDPLAFPVVLSKHYMY